MVALKLDLGLLLETTERRNGSESAMASFSFLFFLTAGNVSCFERKLNTCSGPKVYCENYGLVIAVNEDACA